MNPLKEISPPTSVPILAMAVTEPSFHLTAYLSEAKAFLARDTRTNPSL